MVKSLGASIFAGIIGALGWYNLNSSPKLYPASKLDYQYEITYPKVQFILASIERPEGPIFRTGDLTNLPATPKEIVELIQKSIEYIDEPNSRTIIDYPSSIVSFSGGSQNRPDRYSVDLQFIDTLLKSPDRNNVISFTTLKEVSSTLQTSGLITETIRGLKKRYAGNLDTLFLVPQKICANWLPEKTSLVTEMFGLTSERIICAINSDDTIATLKLKRLENSRTIERSSAKSSLIRPILVGILSAMIAFSLIMIWNSFSRFPAQSAPPK